MVVVATVIVATASTFADVVFLFFLLLHRVNVLCALALSTVNYLVILTRKGNFTIENPIKFTLPSECNVVFLHHHRRRRAMYRIYLHAHVDVCVCLLDTHCINSRTTNTPRSMLVA